MAVGETNYKTILHAVSSDDDDDDDVWSTLQSTILSSGVPV